MNLIFKFCWVGLLIILAVCFGIYLWHSILPLEYFWLTKDQITDLSEICLELFLVDVVAGICIGGIEAYKNDLNDLKKKKNN